MPRRPAAVSSADLELDPVETAQGSRPARRAWRVRSWEVLSLHAANAQALTPRGTLNSPLCHPQRPSSRPVRRHLQRSLYGSRCVRPGASLRRCGRTRCEEGGPRPTPGEEGQGRGLGCRRQHTWMAPCRELRWAARGPAASPVQGRPSTAPTAPQRPLPPPRTAPRRPGAPPPSRPCRSAPAWSAAWPRPGRPSGRGPSRGRRP